MPPPTRSARPTRRFGPYLVLGLLVCAGCTSRPEPDPVPAPPAAPGTPPPVTYGVGDAVEVNEDGAWYPARIVELYDGRYRVQYDEGAGGRDEWVTIGRIRHRR